MPEHELQLARLPPPPALGQGQARDRGRGSRPHVRGAQAGAGASGKGARKLDEAGSDVVLKRVGGEENVGEMQAAL